MSTLLLFITTWHTGCISVQRCGGMTFDIDLLLPVLYRISDFSGGPWILSLQPLQRLAWRPRWKARRTPGATGRPAPQATGTVSRPAPV